MLNSSEKDNHNLVKKNLNRKLVISVNFQGRTLGRKVRSFFFRNGKILNEPTFFLARVIYYYYKFVILNFELNSLRSRHMQSTFGIIASSIDFLLGQNLKGVILDRQMVFKHPPRHIISKVFELENKEAVVKDYWHQGWQSLLLNRCFSIKNERQIQLLKSTLMNLKPAEDENDLQI